MTDGQAISLVLPVYNPGENWVDYTLAKLKELESKSELGLHLIVVNDGSSDHSPYDRLKAQNPNVEVVHLPRNVGKGAALRAGFETCESEYMVFTDADFPYEIDSMRSLINELRSGTDVVLGYREDDYYEKVPWFRTLLSEAFRFVLKTILNFPITDTQCGLKGMNRNGRDVFLKTKINRFLVDMEFIKLAVRSKVRINSCVVKLRDDVEFSKMGLGILVPESFNFLRILFK